MKMLIVEDDVTSQMILKRILEPYGHVDVTQDGQEGLDAFSVAFKSMAPYDLVCLDIMMPGMDGQAVLKEIRRIEEERGIMAGDGVKIIMTSVLNDAQNILRAFNSQCEAYLVKPVDAEKMAKQLRRFGMIP